LQQRAVGGAVDDVETLPNRYCGVTALRSFRDVLAADAAIADVAGFDDEVFMICAGRSGSSC